MFLSCFISSGGRSPLQRGVSRHETGGSRADDDRFLPGAPAQQLAGLHHQVPAVEAQQGSPPAAASPLHLPARLPDQLHFTTQDSEWTGEVKRDNRHFRVILLK